jgi:chemotaxis protein MotB
MSRCMVKLVFLLVLPLLFGYGCGAPDYRASSSIPKLEYWVPEDPWENQKLGICCFVYDEPPAETQSMVATRGAVSTTTDSAPSAQALQESKREPSQELQDSKAAAAQATPVPGPDSSRELRDTKALLGVREQEQADLLKQRDDAIALLQKDQSALRNELDATRAELATKSGSADENARRAKELDVEKAALLKQLDVSRTQLATKATDDQEKADLIRQLEAANAELSAKRTVEKEKADLAAQLEAAKGALAARGSQDKDTAVLAKQLEAANAELEKQKAAQRELALRLRQDTEDMDRARQLRGAQVDLSVKAAEEDRAAQLAKQLETAQAELSAKAAIEKEREDLAKRLEDTRAALAQKAAREEELNRAVQSMEKALKEEIEHGSGSVRRSDNSFTVELKDRILFDSGSASIKSDGLKVLKRVADSLKENADKAVRVEGHTDDVRIRKSPPPRFRSNWELSAARAGNVAEYLEKDLALRAEQLSAAGYSYTRPVVPNENNAARAQNRRVEIIITPMPLTSAMAPAPKED